MFKHIFEVTKFNILRQLYEPKQVNQEIFLVHSCSNKIWNIREKAYEKYLNVDSRHHKDFSTWTFRHGLDINKPYLRCLVLSGMREPSYIFVQNVI